MKKIALIFWSLFLFVELNGQSATENLVGKVSFVSSQNIYVRFKSCEGISAGDTLFITAGDSLVPALIVNSLSSVSCLCSSVSDHPVPVDHLIIARVRTDKHKTGDAPLPVIIDTSSQQEIKPESATRVLKAPEKKQKVRGSISLNSYTDFSDADVPDIQRFRYTLSFNAQSIGGSRFSFESYASFRHKAGEWEEVRDDLFNALKIYNLAIRYDLNETTSFTLGRRINSRIASMGATDGIQFEKSFNNFTVGVLAGSRPDYQNYSFNPGLFQYGAYLAYGTDSPGKRTESSVAFVEQTNDFKTDRRFIYFQHSNSLIKNLSFFSTVEMDLYKVVNDVAESTLDLSGLYLSLSYRIAGKISINGSYDARKNVIYYETYKTFTDRILEEGMRQGYRLSFNWRMVKNMSIGMHAGYRFLKSDPFPSRSLNGYYTWSNIGGLNLSATVTGTWLETSYVNASIAGISFLKDFAGGKFQSGIGYRFADNRIPENEIDLVQHIGEVNLYWHVFEKISLSANYEGTFEKENAFQRIYIQLRKSF
ncbi:MAG: hypothetical protein IH591_02965 [Bacteroidales bacterium]|nr:hypothetical protein [Bacteroidales bacterium]